MTIEDVRKSPTHPPSSRALSARAGPVRIVGLGPSKDPNAKLTLLLLGPTDARAAVKVATTTKAARAIEAERAALLSVRAACRADAVRDTLPEPWRDRFWNGHPALVTSALRGTPMSTCYHRRRHTARRQVVERDFALSAQWLTALQESTAGPTARVDFEAVVERLRRRYCGDPVLAPVLAGLAETTGALSHNRTRRTAVHGDFWCGNILVDSARASGVVDWESAAPHGEPLRDVARFALAYALYLDRHTAKGHQVDGHRGLIAGPWGAGIRYALFGDGWFPELFAHHLADGLRRLGADPGAWRMLAIAGVAEVAAHADHPVFARSHLDLLQWLLAQRMRHP